MILRKMKQLTTALCVQIPTVYASCTCTNISSEKMSALHHEKSYPRVGLPPFSPRMTGLQHRSPLLSCAFLTRKGVFLVVAQVRFLVKPLFLLAVCLLLLCGDLWLRPKPKVDQRASWYVQEVISSTATVYLQR